MSNSSDSEDFESADEDFVDSNDDQTKTVPLPTVVTKASPSIAPTKPEYVPAKVPSVPVAPQTNPLPVTEEVTISNEQCNDLSTEQGYEVKQSETNFQLKTDVEKSVISNVGNVAASVKVETPINEAKQDSTEYLAEIDAAVVSQEKDIALKGQTQEKINVKEEVSKGRNATGMHNDESVSSNKVDGEVLAAPRKKSGSAVSVNSSETVDIDEDAKRKTMKEADPDADGWEFDDWSDEEHAADTTNKSVTDDQDVGWDVWDDQGDEITKAETNKASDQFFPVLADISPKKPTKSDGSLLGNISKFLISDDTSNAFPVQSRNDANEESVAPVTSATNWGWKPWGGVASLLSTATESMATITSNVSSLIESGIGAPDPIELARQQREDQLKREVTAKATLNTESSDGQSHADGENADVTVKRNTEQPTKKNESLYLGSFVSGVTQIGNRVITGGLDTLEGIGKKTMNILQENDPGLLNKRKLLMMDKDAPALSQILREAKEKTEEAEKNLKIMHKQQYRKQLHFETLFDDYHGLVHLEALEMLSRQSTIKLQSLVAPLSGRALDNLQETLDEVKELCELPDLDADADCDGTHTADELSTKLATAVEDLDVQMDFTEMLQCWRDSQDWLQQEAAGDPQAIHDRALRCLAQTTAFAVHRLHKLAELLLIKDRHSTADEADSLVQLTNIVCWHLSGVAARFGGALSQLKNEDEANSLITSTFMEGSNSILYIQNAFQLFIPILQVGAA